MKLLALMILFTGCIATNPPKSNTNVERFSRHPEPFKAFPDREFR